MFKNTNLSAFFVLIVGAALFFPTLSVFLAVDTDSPADDVGYVDISDPVPQTGQERGTRADSPRTVLAELFTNWDCYPHCPYANAALNELLDAYGPSELIMIAYHLGTPTGDDPFYNFNKADNNDRYDYYGGNFGVPRVYFDGPPYRGHNWENTYSTWKNYINTALAVSSPMNITLDGSLGATTGNVTATIEITSSLPSGNLKVRFAVVEDNKYAAGTNGEVRHRYVMRDMLAEEALPPLEVWETYTVSRDFPLSGVYDRDKLSVVVFVQDDNSKDVLQTAVYDFIPQGILVVDDDGSPNPYGYEDEYHELLTWMEYAFDGWTLNERGGPTSEDLGRYEGVIWLTGNTTTDTLTAADQSAISAYLDGGKGSLFLCGENVSEDIGGSPFYLDYLHAFNMLNDTDQGTITGVEFDPISDPFYGGSLPVLDGSPSWVMPIDPATAVFYYSSGGQEAGLRVEHDLDSRVVYFGFLYFEGPDSLANKETVIERVLDWMIVDIDYVAFRDAPGDSGNVVWGKTVDVGEDFTLWAAAYNHTKGFLGNYNFTLWKEDSQGSVITLSPSLATTTAQAGITGGSAVITVRCFSTQNTTTVTVNPPEPDYIQIRSAPNSGDSVVSDMTLSVGKNRTLWAAGYNHTAHYVEDVAATWSEDSGGTIATVTSPGASTKVTAQLIGGICNVTASYNGMENRTTVNVTDATVDYIQIEDSPSGSGSVVSSHTLNVGETLELWACAYNYTANWIGDYTETAWSEDSSGSVVTLNSPTGASIIVEAGHDGGSATVTAEYEGKQASVTIDVNEPTPDYIQIRNAGDGQGDVVINQYYPVGEEVIYYGAVYNSTSSFLYNVPSYSNWVSNNTDLITLDRFATASTITVNNVSGGLVKVTLNALGLVNSTTITIISPTIDSIQIRDSPNGEGDVVAAPVYDVGQEETFYAASYNDTAGHIGDVGASWDCDVESVGNISNLGGNCQ
ncbi:MAG: Omp28-related outer membrane protein, partial [Thermoplasmata archaeon]